MLPVVLSRGLEIKIVISTHWVLWLVCPELCYLGLILCSCEVESQMNSYFTETISIAWNYLHRLSTQRFHWLKYVPLNTTHALRHLYWHGINGRVTSVSSTRNLWDKIPQNYSNDIIQSSDIIVKTLITQSHLFSLYIWLYFTSDQGAQIKTIQYFAGMVTPMSLEVVLIKKCAHFF